MPAVLPWPATPCVSDESVRKWPSCAGGSSSGAMTVMVLGADRWWLAGVLATGLGRFNSGMVSSLSLSASTTGRVIVSRKTLGAATIPSNFPQILFSLNLHRVGNSFDVILCGVGSNLLGHHAGGFSSSSSISGKCSLGNRDTGEALGDTKRILPGREPLWIDQE